MEPVINRSFKRENHYYTSLGNSVQFDRHTADYIRGLIEQWEIEEVYFVLSITNPILGDALENQAFSDIRGLDGLYGKVMRQDKYSKVLYRASNRQFTVLSYHLNKKIKELRSVLQGIPSGRPQITGKIYDKEKDVFHKIYSDLVCTEYFSLN